MNALILIAGFVGGVVFGVGLMAIISFNRATKDANEIWELKNTLRECRKQSDDILETVRRK